MKFTYLEQEAKRNFLYSITGDEPQGVQAGENEDLEEANAVAKGELKALKGEIEEMRLKSVEIAKRNAQSEYLLSSPSHQSSRIAYLGLKYGGGMKLTSDCRAAKPERQNDRDSNPP